MRRDFVLSDGRTGVLTVRPWRGLWFLLLAGAAYFTCGWAAVGLVALMAFDVRLKEAC